MTRSSRPARRPDEGPQRKAKGESLTLGQRIENFKLWLSKKNELAVVEPEHIELGKRVMAIGIDFGAAFLISMFVLMIPLVNRVLDSNLVMLLLLTIRDYFYGGRGVGKNIMGLKVVDIFTGQAPSIRQVLIRNLIYLAPLLFLEILHLVLKIIPSPVLTGIIGQGCVLICTLYVLVILPLECYRSYQRDDSMRLGDEIAGTCLLESETDFSGFLPK